MKSRKLLSQKRAFYRRRGVWIFLILVLLSGMGVAWFFIYGPGASQAGGEVIPTYTVAATRSDLRVSAAGSGKLVAYQSVDLSFPTSGTLATLNVGLGDEVEEGQMLASLGSSETLEANLAAARLQVLEAQQALTDLHENTGLSLAQAYSNLVTAQGNYDTALEDSQRLAYARCGQDTTIRLTVALERAAEKLNNIHAETDASDVYIAARKAYVTALANYNQCAYYTGNEDAGVQSALEVASEALKEAQDTYDTLQAASGIDPDALALAEINLKAAEAQLAKAKYDLAGGTLVAPIDGKITYTAASTGDLVGTSKLITVSDTSHAVLEISVNEADLDMLVIGSRIEVIFDALPDVTFTGKVIQVYPEITNSGQYRIAKGLAELDSDAIKTVFGMPLGLSATVTVIQAEAKDALLVPLIALKDMGDGSYAVMVKDEQGQLRLQMVATGIQTNDYVEIASGLEEGDLVSTGTTNFIAAGSLTTSDSLKNAQNGSGGFPGGDPFPLP